MFKDLFRRAAHPSSSQAAPGRLGPGRRVYAVGDPHGCLDRLQALHRLIAADLSAHPVDHPLLVHLGDYIDRGPDSAGIIALLAAGDPVPGLPTVNLMGNHESMMLHAIVGDDGDAPDLWLNNGGLPTLESWHVSPLARPDAWAAAIPLPHLHFLSRLKRQHMLDGYVFVHAGLRPGVDLGEQSDHDRIWIREPFLSARPPLLPDRPELAVVHGHTPVRTPAVTAVRIGVDTGAVVGGALTAAVLEGDQVRFLSA